MLKCNIVGFGWVAADGFGAGSSSVAGKRFSGFRPGELPVVQRKDLFNRPDRSFGRMDPFSRLGLAGITLALRDAGLQPRQDKESPGRNIGILAATDSGCLYTDLDYFATVLDAQGVFASPQLFAYTLPNTFLGEAALRFGLTGNAQVVNCAANETAHDAVDAVGVLRMAMESIVWGESEKVVVGYCDLGEHGALQAPGALFMVLEPGDTTGMSLQLNDDDKLSCNGNAVVEINDLIENLIR